MRKAFKTKASALLLTGVMLCQSLVCVNAEEASSNGVKIYPKGEPRQYVFEDPAYDLGNHIGDVLLFEDFDSGDNQKFLNKEMNVRMNAWSVGENDSREDGVDVVEDELNPNNQCVRISPKTKGNIGVTPGKQYSVANHEIYEISWKMRKSEDFNGKMDVDLWLCNDAGGVLQGWELHNHSGFRAQDREAMPQLKSDEWTEFRYQINISDIKEYQEGLLPRYHNVPNEKSRIAAFEPKFTAQWIDGQENKGYLYFDDVELKLVTDELVYAPDLQADDQMYWYILGETVGFVPGTTIDTSANRYTKVKLYIYDSRGDVAETIELSAADYNKGFSWKPEKAGFYEYELALIDAEGVEHPWKEWFKVTEYHAKINYRRSMIIAPHETKPMEERRDWTGGTIITSDIRGTLEGNNAEFIDLLGCSSVRLHFVTGERLRVTSDGREVVSPKKGVYNFDYYDEVMDDCKKYGFKNYSITINGATEWANPTGMRADGFGTKTNFTPPIDSKIWNNTVRAIVEHFKDDVDRYELVNEPNYPGVSLFCPFSIEKYIELCKMGYETVKEVDPTAQVSMEAIGSATYLDDLLSRGYYDYFDYYGDHGIRGERAINRNEEMMNIYEKHNLTPKEYNMSEMHGILRRKGYQDDYNEREMGISVVKAYLIAVKGKAKDITMFGTGAISAAQNCAEYAAYLRQEWNTGMELSSFRRDITGARTPYFPAYIMFNFLDQMGKEYEYMNEAKFAENEEAKTNPRQNLVWVKNDGVDQAVVWLDHRVEAEKLSPEIVAMLKDDVTIEDFEFNKIDASNPSEVILQPETVYYITGVDAEKLAELPDGYGVNPLSKKPDLRFANVLFNLEYHTVDEALPEGMVIPEGKHTSHKLFDKDALLNDDSAEITLNDEANIQWNTNDFKWVNHGIRTDEQDITGEFAIHMDKEDGLYLVARAKGDPEYVPWNDGTNLWWVDSLQIAIDALGYGGTKGYMEYSVGNPQGLANENAPRVGTIRKEAMCDTQGFIVKSTEAKQNVVSDLGRSKIETIKNSDGTVDIVYYLWLSKQELAPYEFPADHLLSSTPLRFSLMFNQNNRIEGTNEPQRMGWIEWSSGIGGDKNASYYGRIFMDK